VSPSLIESIILLALTALLTGFVVPYILKRIDEQRERQRQEVEERKLREQEIFEAELARQSKIIESQAILLENIAQIIWEFQSLACEVTYYFLENHRERYFAAVDKYDIESWKLLTQIRTEISKSRRLVSDETHRKLLTFYMETLISLDTDLARIMKSKTELTDWDQYRAATFQAWAELHQRVFHDLGAKNDALINLLAAEFRLTNFDIQNRRLSPPGSQ
jgi:lipopolysaccharide export LptBFGC system permease protein LptF